MKPEEMNMEENDIEPNYQNKLKAQDNSVPQNLSNETQEIVKKRMESLSGSFSGNVKSIESNWEVFSFICWFLYMGAKWDYYVFYINNQKNYRPLVFDKTLLETFTLIISVLGFLIYVINIIYNRKESLYRGLFGEYSRYHFVPLIFYSSLKIVKESYEGGLITNPIGEEYKLPSGISDAFSLRAFYSFVLIFNILILVSIILIYFNSRMKCEWYIMITIKKGVYSILIMESWYGFFESIFFLRYYDSSDNSDNLLNLYKVGGTIFILFIGIGAFIFAFFKKDIMILFVNFFIYLGMIMFFFGSYGPKDEEKELIYGNAEGIIEIVMLCLNILLIIMMIIRFKEELFE